MSRNKSSNYARISTAQNGMLINRQIFTITALLASDVFVVVVVVVVDMTSPSGTAYMGGQRWDKDVPKR